MALSTTIRHSVGASGVVLFLLYFISYLSTPTTVDAVAIFASPYSACNTSCDGSLLSPYNNIQAAMVAPIAGAVTTVVLLPGTYSGVGNINVIAQKHNVPIVGLGPDSTIIDCQNQGFAFNFNKGNYGLYGLTIQNCGSPNGTGAVSAAHGVFTLVNTRWVGNSGFQGGAFNCPTGTIHIDGGPNEFINNAASGTAASAGGAIWASKLQLFISGSEVFQGNSVNGNFTHPSANVYLTSASFIVPNTSIPAPPYSVGSAGLLPAVYVDPAVNCSATYCNGNATYPFGDLRNASIALRGKGGGNLYLAPGTYLGPNNRGITYNSSSALWAPWPGRSGSVIVDCENLSWGFEYWTVTLTIRNITFQNCTTSNPNGGGALFFVSSTVYIYDCNFLTNSATAGPGGAITFNSGLIYMYGGSFVDNWAVGFGGAIELTNKAAVLLYRSIRFSNNYVENPNDTSITTVEDVDCSVNSWVGSDGSIQFDTAGLGPGTCTIRLASVPAVAVFPGSLEADLYPVGPGGNVSSSFGGILFDSVVELDSSGNPIESTRLTQANLQWDLMVTPNLNFTRVQFDSFGPAHQFIRILHDFYNATSEVPGVNNETIIVDAGTVKITIQLALWPFQAAGNSLAFIMKTNSNGAVITTSLSSRPDGLSGTLFTVHTSALTLYFNTLSSAEYDPSLTVKPVSVSTWTTGGNQYFQFGFSQFQSFVSFDPEFSVLLRSVTDNTGSSSAPVGLIVGLAVGLSGLLALIVLGVVVVGSVAAYVRRQRRAARFDVTGNRLKQQEGGADEIL